MKLLPWTPALILSFGWVLSLGMGTQVAMPLRQPLADAIPSQQHGNVSKDVKVSSAELETLALKDYVMRTYAPKDQNGAAYAYSVYVGYYDRQTQGRSIHSPKNCLPGGGWEALSARMAQLQTPKGEVTVNRYLIHRAGARALVLYWYQGRGRVEANEYRVKANLLRDAALRGRTEEALVRVVVPVEQSEAAAFALAAEVASDLVSSVERALPN
jgi:EpsI family protein